MVQTKRLAAWNALDPDQRESVLQLVIAGQISQTEAARRLHTDRKFLHERVQEKRTVKMNCAASTTLFKRCTPNKLAAIDQRLLSKIVNRVVSGELTCRKAAEMLDVSKNTICWHVSKCAKPTAPKRSQAKNLDGQEYFLEPSQLSTVRKFSAAASTSADTCSDSTVSGEKKFLQPMATPIDHDYIVSYRFGLNNRLKENGALIVDVGQSNVRYYTKSKTHILQDGTEVQYFTCWTCSHIRRADGAAIEAVPSIKVTQGRPVGNLLPQHCDGCLPLHRLKSMARQLDRASRLAVDAGMAPNEAWKQKEMAYSTTVPDHRKKWDVSAYAKRAKERIDEEKEKEKLDEDRLLRRVRPGPSEPKIRRELLKPREYKVDLESKVGKSVVINKTTPASESGGYYCDVCDCVVKDSINFLDHINGKKHQKNLGMSMKVAKSTLSDVKERLAFKKQEAERKKKDYDFNERIVELQEEEQKLAEYRRQKKSDLKKRKRERVADEPPLDPDMAALMGFGGFSTSKAKS